MAKQKSNWILYAGLAVAAVAGYFVYNRIKKKKETPFPDKPPIPLPPTPIPLPKPVTPVSNKPSFAKAKELQKLIMRRFAQLNRSDETPAGFDDGDFGDNSNAKLSELRPTTFKQYGAVTNANVDKWITALTTDVTTAEKEAQTQQTKKTAAADQQKLALDFEKHLEAKKGNKIRLLNDITAVKWQWDQTRGRYYNLGDTRKFYKGSTYTAKDIVRRNDGTLGIIVGDFRYFVPASNFITQI